MALTQAFSLGKAVMAPNIARVIIIKAPLIVPKTPPRNLSIGPPPKKTTVSFKDRITSRLTNNTITKIDKNPRIDLKINFFSSYIPLYS